MRESQDTAGAGSSSGVELETKVRPKVHNHEEGPYF